MVDDDPQVLRLVETILHEAGYDVLIASGGWKALEVFQGARNRVDLLITDVVMPDLTGPVLAAKLRNAHPGLKVLFMSGFHDTVMVQHFLKEHGDRLLPKPFTTEGLLRTIKESLN